MAVTSSLTATVEDSDATPVTGATVTVNPVDSRRRIRLTTVAPGQYAVRELTPGEYDVRLSNRGYLTDTYRIQLSPGANSRGFVIGRRGERFYLAAGLRIYFQPVEDRVLLAVYGPEAGRTLEDAATARSMDLQVPSPVEGREPGDSVMRAVSVQPEAATRTPFTPDVVALRDDLEAQGLNVIPALVIQRGSAPPQGLTQELFVQFAPDVSEERVRAIAAEAGLEVRRPVLSTPNAYLLRDPDGPSYELLDVAQGLIENQPVITAEPEVLQPLELDQFTPNDPLYNLQTHLPLIDAADAWEALGSSWDRPSAVAPRRSASPSSILTGSRPTTPT